MWEFSGCDLDLVNGGRKERPPLIGEVKGELMWCSEERGRKTTDTVQHSGPGNAVLNAGHAHCGQCKCQE